MSRGPRWQRDSLDLVKLAWPIIINRFGIMTLSVVDTIMVARYSSEQLAYLGVGLVPSNIAILILVGLILGVQVLVSQNFGAKNYEKCGEIWWRSLHLMTDDVAEELLVSAEVIAGFRFTRV